MLFLEKNGGNEMAKRILLIEGEKSLSRLVSLKLQERGYQTVVSQDGKSGLKTAMEKDFELIFIDLKLPDQDGLELMQELRDINLYQLS